MLNRKLDMTFIRELDTGENGMDKAMFLIAMLVQQELVKKEKDVDPWLAKFDELDTNGDGVIDFDDAIEDLQKENRIFWEQQEDTNILGNLGTFHGKDSKKSSITYIDNPLLDPDRAAQKASEVV